MSAPKILIRLGIKSKLRDGTLRFLPTKTYSEAWVLNTTQTDYVHDIESTLSAVWSYTLAERARNAEVGVHYSITLENVTAAPAPNGAWVQAKGHLDGEISPDQWPDVDVLRQALLFTVDQVLKHAKY